VNLAEPLLGIAGDGETQCGATQSTSRLVRAYSIFRQQHFVTTKRLRPRSMIWRIVWGWPQPSLIKLDRHHVDKG